MNNFDATRYELKFGHFLILSTPSGDKYRDLTYEVVNHLRSEEDLRQEAIRLADHGFTTLRNDESFWLHSGWIIADALNDDVCFDQAATREEAQTKLAEMTAA